MWYICPRDRRHRKPGHRSHSRRTALERGRTGSLGNRLDLNQRRDPGGLLAVHRRALPGTGSGEGTGIAAGVGGVIRGG